MMINKKTVGIIATVIFIGIGGLLYSLKTVNVTNQEMITIEGNQFGNSQLEGIQSATSQTVTNQSNKDTNQGNIDTNQDSKNTNKSNNDLTDNQEISPKEDTPINNEIYVHICGEVVSPGVYLINENARVFDLIVLAGGLTKEAAGESINQARVVADGERIEIPSYEDLKNMTEEEKNTMVKNIEEEKTGTIQSDQKININTASLSDIMTLPGIGQSKANSIIAYRENNGSFKSIEDIMNVEGIKDGTFSKLKDLIRIN